MGDPDNHGHEHNHPPRPLAKTPTASQKLLSTPDPLPMDDLPDQPLAQGSVRSAYFPLLLISLMFITALIVILVYMLFQSTQMRMLLRSSSAISQENTSVAIAPSATVLVTVVSAVLTDTAQISPTAAVTAKHIVVTRQGDTLARLMQQLGAPLSELVAISNTVILLPGQHISLALPLQTPLVTASPTVESAFQYVFPVQPARVATFGAQHHDYPATDIFAPEETVVVAVTDGNIDEISREDVWQPTTDEPAARGGLFVSLIGKDGVRYYYSHLKSIPDYIQPGKYVLMGQVIGFVGKTGNARTTPAHVHFGISRVTRPGDWQTRRGELAPYPYLQDWLKSKNTTPSFKGVK